MNSEKNRNLRPESKKKIVMARPSKFDSERVSTILDAIRNGESVRVAAAKGGINIDTYYEWYNHKPEFSEAVKKARAEFENWEMEGILKDAKRSLKRLICGEEYDETKTEYEQDPRNPAQPRIKRQTVTRKKVLPNATAVIFALINRDPENWKNRTEQTVDAKVTADQPARVDLSGVSDELLEQLADAIRGEE